MLNDEVSQVHLDSVVLRIPRTIQPQSFKGTKKHKEKEQRSITLDRCNRFLIVLNWST